MRHIVFSLHSAGRRSIVTAPAICAFVSLIACGSAPDSAGDDPAAPEELGTATLAVCTPETGTATYHGGSVVSNVRVTAVYWTSAVSFQSSLPSFYSSVTSSSYFDWLSEYQTCTQSIGRGSLLAAVVDASPIPAGTTVQDSDIESELPRLIQNGALPAPAFDGNGFARDVYMVHFPPGIAVQHQGRHSCPTTQGEFAFCGYHSAFPWNGRLVPYAAIAGVEVCGGLCGPGDGLGNTTSTASHELLEAVTDPLRNFGAEAWNTRTPSDTGQELADLCQGQNGQVAGFTVQRAWSDQLESCVLKNPCQSCPGGTSCFCGDSVCRASISMCP
jgi:hypothetical protein